MAKLQAITDGEREKMIRMQLELEEQRLQIAQLNCQLEAERRDASAAAREDERLKHRHLKETAERLEVSQAPTPPLSSLSPHLRFCASAPQHQNKELSRELQFAGDQVAHLQKDREHLQTMLAASRAKADSVDESKKFDQEAQVCRSAASSVCNECLS